MRSGSRLANMSSKDEIHAHTQEHPSIRNAIAKSMSSLHLSFSKNRDEPGHVMYGRPEWEEEVYDMPSEVYTTKEKNDMQEFLRTLSNLPAKLQPEVMYAVSSTMLNESLAGVSYSQKCK